MVRKLPLAPFLFGLLPIASQMAYNLGAVPLREALRPAVVILLATALILYLSNRWFGDLKSASALVSLASVLFFVHGALLTLALGRLQQAGLARRWPAISQYFLVSTDSVIFLAEAAGLILVMLLLRRAPRHMPVVNQFLVGLAVIGLAFPLFKIGSYAIHGLQLPPAPRTQLETDLETAKVADRDAPPDIYYIVLDGYGREDLLEEGYEVDTSDFLNALEGLGFDVASHSQSNYSFTLLSLTSSMNMTYVDGLGIPADPGTPFDDASQRLIPLLRQSALRRILEEHGYRTVAFASGFSWTELWGADEYRRPRIQGISPFESLIIRSSLLGMAEDFASVLGAAYPYSGYQAHRQRIQYALDELPSVAREPGPKFVFVHLLMPHPPFVFYRDGTPYPERRGYSIGDATQYTESVEEYVAGYKEAVLFLDRRLIPVLRGVLENSPAPPIIVLQGDHGPGARLEWDDATERAVRERMGILNAYYFPENLRQPIPDSVTPVNSFRMVLDQVLDAKVESLPDRSYYSSPNNPYALTPVPPAGQ